jgi:pseudouridine kinase
MSNKILVIGAENIDIFASTNDDYLLHDSNLATINLGIGGVGGNIATNLNTLGEEVSFITVFGNDLLSQLAYNHFTKRGIDCQESLHLENERNSVYLGIMDKDNDLYLGLNDMGILKNLDVPFFKSKADFINKYSIIVIDNNLSHKAITYLVKTYQNKTIIMDAVSAKKASKLNDLLPYITILKVNTLELSVLSQKSELKMQISDLLSRGIKELLVTNKHEDIYYATKDVLKIVKPYQCSNIINATGAGDAFISGFIHGVNNDYTIDKKIEEALKLAYLTLQVDKSTIEKVK